MERIEFFKVHGLNGFINTELHFNKDLTILYGLNGSGKTSVLKLIANLANGNITKLLDTQFQYARLSGYRKNSQELIIEAENKGTTFIFRIISSDDPYIYQCDRKKFRSEESHSYLNDEFNSSEAGAYLRKLASPVFLDINRTFLDDQHDDSDRLMTDYLLRKIRMRKRSFSKQSRFETMEQIKKDQGLMYAISLIERELFKVSQAESRLNRDFRNSVLTESLKTTSIESFDGNMNIHYVDASQLDDQEQTVMKMLNKLNQNDLKVHASKLFNGARLLLQRKAKFDSTKTDERDISLLFEIMINKSKLDYLETISKLAQQYSDKLDEAHAKFNLFLSLTNRFFNMIGKEVIASDGTVLIRRKGGKCEIGCLSSGERQIVIMMAHLLFNPQLSRKSVFMLDEPELSLHIAWQEILLGTIMESNPGLQLIVATHAPSIIGPMEDKCVLINE